jgi:hypothetical protein
VIKNTLKKAVSLVINVFLFWTFLICLNIVLDFLGWAIAYESLDFHHWWWHNMEEGSLTWGVFTLLVSFPLALLIVKKIHIKL